MMRLLLYAVAMGFLEAKTRFFSSPRPKWGL